MFPQANIPLFRAKSATENTRNYCHQDRLQVQKRVPPKKRPGEQDDVECGGYCHNRCNHSLQR